VDQAYNHQPGDTATIAKDLQSACVDDRALAIWALGSIHDQTALPALQAYVAAHPDGDWRRAEYDLVPVAQAAIAYIQAPPDTTHTYMVRPRGLYAAQPKYDADGNLNRSPVQTIPAGAPLIRVQKIHTGDMRPDHGGETEVVFERVQRPNDPQTYYLEVSRYVSTEPSYFEPVDLEPNP
jgi:hypothetical protein